jgi:hypothetical protein
MLRRPLRAIISLVKSGLLVSVFVPALLVACTDDGDPDIRIERQSSTLAEAKDVNWSTGGAVLAAQPGSFAFPQPLALRISLVDSKAIDENGVAAQLALQSVALAAFGTGTFEIATEPTCQENYCEAELRITAAGSSMLTVEATGAASEGDCFYYAIIEDAAPETAGAALRTELETRQRECYASLFD